MPKKIMANKTISNQTGTTKTAEKLEYLESLSDQCLSKEIRSLDAKALDEVTELVTQVLKKEGAGLDSLFDSMTHTMKYIPNVLLQSLTRKYIEPPIAARIASRLTLKQSLGVVGGLSPGYIAQTTHYLDTELAGEILAGMKRSKAIAVLQALAVEAPLKVLDLCTYIESDLLQASRLTGYFEDFDEEGLTEKRRLALKRI